MSLTYIIFNFKITLFKLNTNVNYTEFLDFSIKIKSVIINNDENKIYLQKS